MGVINELQIRGCSISNLSHFETGLCLLGQAAQVALSPSCWFVSLMGVWTNGFAVPLECLNSPCSVPL